ncbi:DUF5708 family protein [Streptomyces sp. URMC 123]|uniref:DUF5708 family protein n=1 Tax=Streptomyces sp. URMC 123 TaxID=3423403 RepID=UPI003F1C1C97
MSRAVKNLAEGAVTFLVGLALKLYTQDVEIPIFTLPKVGVVMMCVGGFLVIVGLYEMARRARAQS